MDGVVKWRFYNFLKAKHFHEMPAWPGDMLVRGAGEFSREISRPRLFSQNRLSSTDQENKYDTGFEQMGVALSAIIGRQVLECL